MKNSYILALFVFFIISVFSLNCNAKCNKECVSTIKGLLEERRTELYTTWLQKSNRELGDGVAVGLSKIYSKRNIAKPQNIRLFIPIIKEAFKDLNMIIVVDNKKPINTIKLLETLKEQIKESNSDLYEEINQTIEFVKQQTNTSSNNQPLYVVACNYNSAKPQTSRF